MELVYEYGLFLAKAVTVVLALLIIVGSIAATARERREPEEGEIRVTSLNDRYEDMADTLQHATLTKEAFKHYAKDRKKTHKQEQKKTEENTRKKVFVLDFVGDMKAEGVDHLAQEITAVLTIAKPTDEVVVRLESPGGQVHGYGLAASQLLRLKQHNIPLTVCVDRVAASGGYMMACIANRIVAAPFAILGSIGVVAELPNFNRLIRKWDVDYDIYTAGEFKRTVTMLGENTEEGKRKFLEEIEETHQLFKALVAEHRAQLDMQHIATGEHWYGSQALDLKLIDAIQTSDDYLFAQRENADLFEVKYEYRKTFADRLGLNAERALQRSLLTVFQQLSERGKRIIG